jgi:hypothetical protein
MRHARPLIRALLLLLALSAAALAAEMPAVVHKPSVDVHSGPDFATPKVATLLRNAKVAIAAQQGLWYQLKLEAGKAGYVRVNDVRMAYAGAENPDANMRALFTGNAGKGRVSETASVRGIDESDLRAAGYNGADMAKLEGYRVDTATAAAHAAREGWRATQVPYAAEARPDAKGGSKTTQAQKRGGLSAARGLLAGLGIGTAGDSALRVADSAASKSEDELTAEELALGPEIAGRVLGAAPLSQDDDAQRRVNLIGRWVASQTARPDLPWAFGVLDDDEINAFAAPGGCVLITRGLYELLAGDAEVAAVIAHELGHVVQRDHYEVIRKQEVSGTTKDIALSQVQVGGGIAGSYAKDYVGKHGATIMLTGLDREAEYRADEAAGVYLARAGFDPLALYSVLQKMTALGTRSSKMAQLYKTHPPLDQRLARLDH